MLPTPLHPAVVHFPIVLMMLLPLVALGALLAIRRGTTPLKAWAFPVACAAALSLSALLGVETGEQEEEKVESVVPEKAIGEHADAAERFLLLSAGVLLLTATGLLRGRVGGVVRGMATVATLGLVAAGYQVGHSGGSLVYAHGAGAAYATQSPGGETGRGAGSREGEDHERTDRTGGK